MSLVPADAVTVLGNREASPKVASTGPKSWHTMQPNPGGIQGFRAAYESISRQILSKNLTPEAGDHVGMSVSPSLVQDVTMDQLDFWGGDVWRCAPKHGGNKGQSLYRPTAVTSTGYTVAALGDLEDGLLVYARGFGVAANNGLKLLADTSIAGEIKTPGLVAETNPANAIVSVAGVQGATSDYELDGSGDLICTAGNFTTKGLIGGQIVKLGGAAAANQFATAAYNGFAEVDPTRAITATKLPLRNHSWTVGAADDGDTKAIQVFFTAFYRQWPLGHANFSRATSQLELEQPGAGAADASSFRYTKGLRVGNAEIDAPLKSKIVLTLGFIGLDVPDPSLSADRPADTATPLEPLRASMFDTTSDYKHLRLSLASTNVEVNGTNSHIQAWRFSQNLNLSPVEVHGVLGANDHIDGQMAPSMSFDTYMATDEFVKAVKANTNHRFCAVFGNEDGGWALNLPSGKLRGDEEEMAAGEGVMVSIDFVPHREPASGILSSMSTFAYLP